MILSMMRFISDFVRGDNFWLKYFIVVFIGYYIKYMINYLTNTLVNSAGYYESEVA